MAGCFKTYDIRGIVGKDLVPERAYLIGRAAAAVLYDGQGPIVITRDMRASSPDMAGRLADGLRDGGCDVIDGGLAATPMNYWLNVKSGARGSVSVTASHNGPAYNGFKFSGVGAVPYDYAGGIRFIEEWVLKAEAEGTPAAKGPQGSLTPVDRLSEYLDDMRRHLTAASPRPLKVAIDCGNGMGGHFLPAFCAAAPWMEVVPLFWELDGTFPNHEADPLKPENLVDLQAAVTAHGCDLGVAYDGDADRCMFVDETGASISSDLVTALLAGPYLERRPGAAILYDLRSSRIVPETIRKHGGVPIRGKVGHTNMKRLLREHDAPFGGELSGHYYFADLSYTDSGIMAMIQMINLWQSGSEPLSERVRALRVYSASGEINYRVPDVKPIMEKVEAHYAAAGAEIDHLDGLSVDFPTWWFSLRSSNTEPLLRLNLEAATPAERDALVAEVQGMIGAEPAKGH